MSRTLIYLLALSLASPAMASAATWTVKATSAQPTLGKVTPSGYQTYTDSGSHNFEVAPFDGYSTTKILLDGANVGTRSPVSVTFNAARLSRNLTAYFIGKTYQVTAVQAPGGSISSSTSSTVAYGKNKSFTIAPNAGNSILDIKVDGASIPAAELAALPAATNGGKIYTFSSVKASHTITARFIGVTANAGLDRNVVTGQAAAIDATAASPLGGVLAYEWSLADKPAGSSLADTLGATEDLAFTPDVDGAYTLQFRAIDGGIDGTDTVVVTSYATPLAASQVCFGCHNQTASGAKAVNGWTASSHNTGNVICSSCHVGAETTSHPGIAATANVCSSCHTVAAAPHIQTAAPDAGGYYPTTSYITAGGATCVDCHGHNNSSPIKSDWAESGHGDTTAVAFKSDGGHNWNSQGTDGVNYQVSPQKTNCVRCHTASGFAQYWDSGFSNINKIKLADGSIDKASAPLVCNGCHTSADGDLRPLPAGYARVSAFYGYSNATFAPKKIAVSLSFTDNKNSNICIPCHSQRASGTQIKELFAAGAFKQYSVGTNTYPHEAQPAAVVDGKGGYEFASAQGYQDRMRHIRIGNYGTNPAGYNDTGITSGNCAGCHMTSEKTHSLESVTADATTGLINGIVSENCEKCHPATFTYQDIQAKKDEFNAAVKTLGNLLVAKGFTQDGVNVIAERKTFDMSRDKNGVRTKDNAIAEKNLGAWFNWYLFKTADKAGFVHNPAYSRRLINDSIDWLDDNAMNDSAAATIFAQLTAGTLSATEKDQALAQLNNPGCMGCHFGTGSTHNGEAVPGVEQAPHYNTTGALVPGQTFTQAQFVTPDTQCNYCHGYGHGTDSPGGSILADYAESGHADINGLAWTDYDFKTRATCNACHTTKGFVTAVNNGFTNTAAWGSASDTAKQVLGCNTCHNSTAWATSVRNTGAYSAGMGGYGAAAVATVNFDDVGQSNVCLPCHASRENGATINAVTDYTNASFKNPHYLAAAAVFYGKGGFQFYTSGVRYNTYGAAGKIGKGANWSHGRLGMDNYSASGNNDIVGASNNTGTGGQCVACHMGPNNSATLKGNHTFDAIKVAKSTNATGCYGCHKTSPSHAPGDIAALNEEEREIFERGMDFFKWQLEQVNMFYTESHPYFVTVPGGTSANAIKNWTQSAVTPVGPVGGSGAQNMGAAMNFKLLHAEKGAHVHNRAFARALIADSIVYLQNGTVGDRTVGSTNVNNVINFSNYSSYRTATPDSNPVSIGTLKGWLTRLSGGTYYRR